MNIQEVAKSGIGKYVVKIFENQDAFEKGIVKSEVEILNKVTNASLAVITGLMGNTGAQTAFTYLELGTSSQAVSASDTALIAAITDTGLQRQAATVSRTTITQTNDTLQLVGSWAATGSKTIQEIGVFNASSSGVMLSRVLTGSQSVVNGNIVSATYTYKAVGN